MRVDWIPPAAAPVRLDRDPRWRLLRLAGHGAPEARPQTEGAPGRDERTAVHATAQPRVVSLTLRLRGDTVAEFEANRAALADALAPWRDAVPAALGELRLTLSDGRVRACRAYARDGLGWTSQRGASAVETIVLEAPEPFWFDPAVVQVAAALGPAGALRFNGVDELAFPAGFGPALPGVPLTIDNTGSAPAFPVVRFSGPVTNPSATHADGRRVAFDLTVPAGLTLEALLGPQPDGSADAPAAALVDDIGGRTSALGALRAGSRFWPLHPGLNSVVLSADALPAGPAEVRFFPRHIAA